MTPRADQPAGTPVPARADWITSGAEARGIAQYLQILRGGIWLVVGCVVVALIAAGAYLALTPKKYVAHAQLLVTPLSGAVTPIGLGLITESSDPLRSVETAAEFVKSTRVAQRVLVRLGLRTSTAALFRKISVQPVAQSDIVDIAAMGSSPLSAQRLADAFALDTIAQRTDGLHTQIAALVPAIRAQLAAVARQDASTRTVLGGQLAQLLALGQSPDPTLRVEALADRPTAAASPRPAVTVAAALLSGLVLGIAAVLLLRSLDSRLRREEQLHERFLLPVLARVGKEPAGTSGGPLLASRLSGGSLDAYRVLSTIVRRSTPELGGTRAVLVTGPSPSDGKTTTAINLTQTLAAAGQRVVLIEGDTRRPSIGGTLQLEPLVSVGAVVSGEVPFAEALVWAGDDESSRFRVLLASPEEGASVPLSGVSGGQLLASAQAVADWVVIDAPPLAAAPELLDVATLRAGVLLVVRLGNTKLRALDQLAGMLAQHGVRPQGFIVMEAPETDDYYYAPRQT